jgi:hypothetical protein
MESPRRANVLCEALAPEELPALLHRLKTGECLLGTFRTSRDVQLKSAICAKSVSAGAEHSAFTR